MLPTEYKYQKEPIKVYEPRPFFTRTFMGVAAACATAIFLPHGDEAANASPRDTAEFSAANVPPTDSLLGFSLFKLPQQLQRTCEVPLEALASIYTCAPSYLRIQSENVTPVSRE